ncbi:MAG: S1 RNA-binding domain-containing protein [Planctomycetota bacterium]|nr:S1 RNA-binding domain-containing protein [Planctomycetota bacterium]
MSDSETNPPSAPSSGSGDTTPPPPDPPRETPVNEAGQADLPADVASEIDDAMRSAMGESSPKAPESPPDETTGKPASAAAGTAGDLEAEIADALAGVDLMSLGQEDPAPQPGDRINLDGGRRTKTGRIALVRGGDVLVEFGPKRQGFCPLAQFDAEPAIGSEVEFLVERLDAEGLFVLSLPGAVQKADWGNLETGQTVEGRVTGVNKGGLEVEVAKKTGFMPAGQIDIRHIADISTMLGEKVTCRVTQLDKKRGRLILSRRAVIEEERKASGEKLLKELQPGQRRKAVVTSIQAFGAFADLGGVDGLIHVSELAHERVRDPGQVVKVGEELEVEVTKVDTSGDQPRIGLSRKAVLSDPRAELMGTLEAGATVAGTVKKITDFGAFLEVAEGVEGLLHVSEISHRRIDRVDRELRVGEVVQVKILSIDPDKGRISLSKKALEERPAGARGRGNDGGGDAARPEDPVMKKLRAKFSGDLKGGLG